MGRSKGGLREFSERASSIFLHSKKKAGSLRPSARIHKIIRAVFINRLEQGDPLLQRLEQSSIHRMSFLQTILRARTLRDQNFWINPGRENRRNVSALQ